MNFLNEQMVRKLSVEQMQKLNELEKEYHAAVEGVRTRRTVFLPNKEASVRRYQASKKLAEFYMQHNLLR